MNKLFTKIATAFAGMAMAVGVGVAVSSKNVSAAHAADTKVSMTTGSNTVAIKVNWNSAGVPSSNNGVRMGTSSNAGSATFSIPSGTTKFGFYAVGWNGKSTTASVSASVGTIATSTASLTSNSAASGTINANATVAITETEENAKKEFTISGVTATSTITLTTSGSNKRLIAWDAYYVTADKTLSSISVSTAPTKTSYLEGEYFSPSGLVITRTYTDSTSDTYAYAGHTSEFTFSPSTSTALTTSNTSVAITYGGKTTSQAITVTAPKTPGSVSSSGQTTTFDAGDTFVYGGTLTATYTDSTSSTVTPTSFKVGNAGINPTTSGTVITPGTTELTRDDHNGKTIYVLYTENNTTVYTSYIITVNAVSSVTFVGGTDKGDVQNSITKSGITISVPTTADGTFIRDDNFRVYANKDVTIESTIGNIAKIEFTFTTEGYNTLSGSGYTSSGASGTWMGDASSVTLSASSQARITLIVVTLASTDPLVELTVDSATSVSMMKGDTDTNVKVHVANITTKTWSFTFDEGESTGLLTSAYINVSAGAAVSDVHTLTITTKAVGSTTMHIAVSGTACETAVPVTVNAKPASMTIDHGDIHEGELEIITGEYKQVSFSGLDTDGNPYSIAAADVTPSATSGASYVTLSGSGITGKSQGTAVVRYTLNALTSVYAEVTVNVVDDYIETVGEPTFATGLTDTQGQSPDVSVFTSRPGTMHSGTSTTIPFENYKFSYDSTYASAEYGDVFSYDFSHGTTVDSTHMLQTIYVFCDIDEVAHGSYTVTVEQFNDPLTAITLTNVVNNEVDVNRGSSFQLEWAYTPTNPTDGKEVVFRIDDNTDGIGITVSQTGLINISADSDLGTALVVIESAHKSSIYDYVYVTAALESMTYIVSEEESWTLASSLSVGDRIAIVYENGDTLEQLSGVSSNIGQHTSYTTAGEPSNQYLYTVGSGNVANSYTFSNDDGYLAYTSSSTSSNNNLHLITNPSSNDQLNQVSWTIDFSDYTIQNVYNTGRSIRYNTGSPRFCCYMNKGQAAPKIYKLSGGDTPFNVTEVLFNGVHNNFGTGKTYEWDATCSEFDENAWLDACVELTEITSYSSYKLNRAVANESGNEIEVFLAKYDNIIRKFGDTHDHLDRFAVGGINHGSITKVNSLNIVSNSGTEVAIIVVASMIGLSTVGGYFFLRKRKEI